jgi:hypothetical protein
VPGIGPVCSDRNLYSSRWPRVLDSIEGNNGSLRKLGEEEVVPGGVFDHSTYEEDAPITWEPLASP